MTTGEAPMRSRVTGGTDRRLIAGDAGRPAAAPAPYHALAAELGVTPER